MRNEDLPYYDELLIIIRGVEHGWIEGPPLCWATANIPSGHVDLTKLAADLERVTLAPPLGEFGVDTYRSEITSNHVSWGADASILTAILEVGGIAATGEYFLKAIRFLAARHGTNRGNNYRHHWSDPELIEHARRMYARSQGVNFGEVEAVGIERASGSEEATVRLVIGGKHAAVGIRMMNEIPIVTKLDRDI